MFWQGVVVRLGGCDAAQEILGLFAPGSARGLEKNLARPMPHFAASAHCRSLEVWIRSVPMKCLAALKCGVLLLLAPHMLKYVFERVTPHMIDF
jgi:hypothetical protein